MLSSIKGAFLIRIEEFFFFMVFYFPEHLSNFSFFSFFFKPKACYAQEKCCMHKRGAQIHFSQKVFFPSISLCGLIASFKGVLFVPHFNLNKKK